MDDSADPIHHFFTEHETSDSHILYTVLSLQPSCSQDEIKKAYRKAALRSHPDKHAGKSDKDKEKTGVEFQRVGFAYAVLGDEGRRKRYDQTGRTDESHFADAEGMGWEAYFESLFQRIDKKMLDEHKTNYQGSEEEKQDIVSAYRTAKGSLSVIMHSIPHSDCNDETRFITLINESIADGTLESTKMWNKSSTDEAARRKRAAKGKKEAQEAEETAKELGVWDEFYGSGKKGKRQADERKGGKEGNEAGLQALIAKRQQERGNGLDAMEEKYRRIEEEARAKKKAKIGKGKKGKMEDEVDGLEDETMPPISDADFDALQAKMFGKKEKGDQSGAKGRKSKA